MLLNVLLLHFTSELSILQAASKYILDVVEIYITLNDGREQTNENKKMDLTPTTLDAKLKMKFTNLTQPVELWRKVDKEQRTEIARMEQVRTMYDLNTLFITNRKIIDTQ